MLVSALLSSWVYSSLGEYFFVDLRVIKDHVLVRRGPYRYIRHPMYSVLFLSIISSVLVASDACVLGTGLLLAIVICLRIPHEERMLEHHFGWEYARYKKRTGALLPRLKP
ncbi:MAG: Isoprenylcysteine carboxyl methyltransferase [Parcubacteria group bacterium]|nr:Isoprenylcysteine carboxyl methyltransferase [Parcubacteria group bacterium]